MVTPKVPVFTHGPGVVYVTTQVFRALALKSISPVEVDIKTSPAGAALNAPPDNPVMVGVGSAPVLQKVECE